MRSASDIILTLDTPRIPGTQAALQSFAWTENGRQEKVQARTADGSASLAKEPVFCFETAVRPCQLIMLMLHILSRKVS